MNPQSICCLLILVYTLSCFPCLESKPVPHQRLLVILLDGFRFDYLNQSSISLPGFDKIAKQGVKAGGFVPDTPSLSYPNYYSIMTGMFQLTVTPPSLSLSVSLCLSVCLSLSLSVSLCVFLCLSLSLFTLI